MIAVYAQATDRQGVDVALDGLRVESDDQRFADLWEKSSALYLRRSPIDLGGVSIHCGLGVARLQFEPSDADLDDSPIVIVGSARIIREGGESVAVAAMNSVSAIGREVDVKDLTIALRVAARTLRTIRARQVITIGLGASAVAITATLIARALVALRQ